MVQVDSKKVFTSYMNVELRLIAHDIKLASKQKVSLVN